MMRDLSTAFALLFALPSCLALSDGATDEVKRLRNTGNALDEKIANEEETSLNGNTRRLLLDFSAAEFWESYANEASSLDTKIPTMSPTTLPTLLPTTQPTLNPTLVPTPAPTLPPTVTPVNPSLAPYSTPPPAPVAGPTISPSSTTFPPITASPTLDDAPVIMTVSPTPEITFEPTPTGPAPNAPIPGPETPAPTAAPQQTPAPVAATPAPVAVTPAPVAVTPAPVAVTPAPVVATPAPVAATPAPQATPAPDTPAPTIAPVATAAPTEAPIAATDAPTAAPVATAAPTPSGPTVADRLQPFLLQGGSELTDPGSYQSCAVRRVAEQLGVDDFTDAKLVQYYALYSIFCSTNAVPNAITNADSRFQNITVPEWGTTTGWQENDRDPCSGWYGVVCVNDQVTELNLFDNLLTGVWPLEITLLASDGPTSSGAGAIFKIDLFNNEFLFNDFDNSWISSLGSAMRRLYFQATAFAGSLAPLPPNIFEFDCSFTLIDGGLTDANFANLDTLNWALLDGNAYNSTIPSVFGSLPELEFLFISDGFISGDLSHMQGMPKIIEHWVDVNTGLSGTIPAFIGNIQTLRSFSVTQASLTGTIPPELGSLTNMIQMWFYANALSGTIPPELAIRSLKILQLEGNSFAGTMPQEICQLTQFPATLDVLGVDCKENECDPNTCCTCCSLSECNPNIFLE